MSSQTATTRHLQKSAFASHAMLGLSIFAAIYLLERIDWFYFSNLGYSSGLLLVPSILYAAKTRQAYLLRFGVRRSWIVFLIYCIPICVLGIFREWNNPHITWLGFFPCLPIILIGMPVLSLWIDTKIQRRGGTLGSPLFMFWRSVGEVAYLYPIWAFITGWLGIMVGGWWI